MSSPDPEHLRAAFGLADIDHESLTPWASVFRGRTTGGAEVVVKRTAQAEARANAMVAWTRVLDAAGVPTVVPAALDAPNPQEFGAGDETAWWIAYPYIDGRPYAGAADVEAAGDLLGRIHAVALTSELRDLLRPYPWPETTRADVDHDLASLEEVLTQHAPERAEEAVANVRALGERWWTSSLPTLCEADAAEPLPRAGVTSDFKANNLVWARHDDGERPVLVDPDNGGWEPRLFDLALALVLFHNECPTAPGRMLTPREWERFASAYLAHVQLTDRERDLWSAAVDHMLWEEGTWALEDNDADAWANPTQGAQLLDVALATPERYPLPR